MIQLGNININQRRYQEFDKRLLAETNLLEKWFIEQIFIERELEAGSEIELFLLDNQYNPAPYNLDFIKKVNQSALIPEVGAAHLEINTRHVHLYKDGLSKLHQSILSFWRKCCNIARQNQYHLALIGTLPTATGKHIDIKYMTNKKRYHLINDSIQDQCAGQPILINLLGAEHLKFPLYSLTVNGLISAFQIHIQVGLSQSVKYYNIAQAIAGPMLALACNSPFILGKHIWADSRVFLFEQAMTLPRFDRASGFKCCFFGIGYLKNSFFELFDQNYHFFPRLIPEVSYKSPKDKMFHVRRQNGVIYRWNRPVIDFNDKGQPHLRIEHRGLSSGPTIIDMIANATFFYGLLSYFSLQSTPIEYLLPFCLAKRNFFEAARYGFDAKFVWFLGKKINAFLLLKELLPLARQGLLALGINYDDIELYLSIIDERITKRMNGSAWQCQFIDKYGRDFHNMLDSYLNNQYQELPIAQWTI
ncbi:glutamate-cysteine ligase family protein [Legionella sp. CNM-1927-20]|uniref:glutamate-cysteine ligase family protein n=1 Tax=Legionella sp. CNM-1927-20 TaxID=3422221 RepID=UPI00403AA7FF